MTEISIVSTISILEIFVRKKSEKGALNLLIATGARNPRYATVLWHYFECKISFKGTNFFKDRMYILPKCVS